MCLVSEHTHHQHYQPLQDSLVLLALLLCQKVHQPNFLFNRLTYFFLGFKDFSIEPMFGVVLLTWSVLEDVSIDEYSYEIGIAEYTGDLACSSVNHTTLPGT